MQAVDAQLMGQIVKVGVVGAHDGGIHINPAITTMVPVAVLMVKIGQLVVPRVKHARLSGDDPAVQTGDGHLGFDSRAGRIQASQDTIEQRSVNGVVQCSVFLETDAGDEEVRVETGLADHGQHFARLRVQRNHRTSAITQGLLCCFLKFDVEAQDDIFSRDRVGVFEYAKHPALSVGLDFFIAYMAMEFDS